MAIASIFNNGLSWCRSDPARGEETVYQLQAFINIISFTNVIGPGRVGINLFVPQQREARCDDTQTPFSQKPKLGATAASA